MSDDPYQRVGAATRRFRRRVVGGRSEVRQRYLPPELREEAEQLRSMIDQAWSSLMSREARGVSKRVTRIREGATVIQSRRRDWKKYLDEDDE